MKKILLFTFLFYFLISCNYSETSTSELSVFIPESSVTVLKISDLESFQHDLENNNFLKKTINRELKNKDLDIVKNLKTTEEILLCISQIDNEKHISIITKYDDSLLKNFIKNKTTFYTKLIDSTYILSSSKKIINTVKPISNFEFEKLEQTINKNASFSLFLNHKNSDSSNLRTFDLNKIAKSFMLDINMNSDQINLNGISTVKSSTQLLSVFSQTEAQENTLANITPNDSDGFLSLTFDNYENFKSNIQAYLTIKKDSTLTDFWLNSINEIGQVYLKNSSVIVCKSLDPSITKEGLLENQDIVSTYREVTILKFTNPKLFNFLLSPFLSINQVNFYAILDNYFIFATSESDLQTIISNYKNGSTLNKNASFEYGQSNISDEGSLLLVVKTNKLNDILFNVFKLNTDNFDLNSYQFAIFQFVQDDEFMHVNMNLNKHKSTTAPNTISEEFNLKIDANIRTTPQFVINHRNNQKDIIVQDVKNKLYLINNKGRIIWKKQLNGSIIGKVEQIDIYKNGRLQLSFATPNRLYVVDRNGNDVGPFPLKFKDDITQPLSVFDYDNRKNYRLLVTQGDALLMYNVNGQLVKGFKYKKTNQISSQPKHFRINGKDYIVFVSGKNMNILNRKGQIRINVNQSIDFSGNDIYLYKNQFTTTSKNGELIQVNTNGAVSEQSLNFGSNHSITATSKTLSVLSDNYLTIKQHKNELEFGNYTDPLIFYLNDKIYVSTTDLQSKKIYLFDSSGIIQKNFPVYGNSAIDLKNIDGDNKLEFVTVGDNNSIILYQKN